MVKRWVFHLDQTVQDFTGNMKANFLPSSGQGTHLLQPSSPWAWYIYSRFSVWYEQFELGHGKIQNSQELKYLRKNLPEQWGQDPKRHFPEKTREPGRQFSWESVCQANMRTGVWIPAPMWTARLLVLFGGGYATFRGCSLAGGSLSLKASLLILPPPLLSLSAFCDVSEWCGKWCILWIRFIAIG